MGPRPSATPAAEPGSLWGEGLLGFSVNSATPASEGHKKIVFMGPASFLHHLPEALGTAMLRGSSSDPCSPHHIWGQQHLSQPLVGQIAFSGAETASAPLPSSSPCSPSPTAAPSRNPLRLAPKGGRDRKEPEKGETRAKVQGWQLNLLQFTVPPQNKKLGPVRPHSTSHEQPRPPWGPPAAGAFGTGGGNLDMSTSRTDGRTDGQMDGFPPARPGLPKKLSYRTAFLFPAPGELGRAPAS